MKKIFGRLEKISYLWNEEKEEEVLSNILQVIQFLIIINILIEIFKT